MIDYYGSKVRVKFNKGCLKQPNKLTYDYGRKVNIYIVYELGASSSNNSDPMADMSSSTHIDSKKKKH